MSIPVSRAALSSPSSPSVQNLRTRANDAFIKLSPRISAASTARCFGGPSEPGEATSTSSKVPSKTSEILLNKEGGVATVAAVTVVGRIEVICGPMFAGKSTELLRRVREELQRGGSALLIKSKIDNRYSCAHITTHAGDKLPCIATDRLLPVLLDSAFFSSHMIAIDEAQFFPDLLDFAQRASDMHNKTVIVAGLDGDYKRQKFGQILDLVPISDSVMKVSGKCHFCAKDSLFSFRVAADERQELVGGGDKYVPCCRHHYAELSRTRQMCI